MLKDFKNFSTGQKVTVIVATLLLLWISFGIEQFKRSTSTTHPPIERRSTP